MPNVSGTTTTTGWRTAYQRDNVTGAVTNIQLLSTTSWSAYTLIRSGSVTPNFVRDYKKRNRVKHDLPMNPFSFTMHSKKGFIGSREVTNVNETIKTSVTSVEVGQHRDDIDDLKVVEPSTAEKNSLSLALRTRTRLDLKDQMVNLVQAFAERRQTANLLATTVRRFADSVTALRRGNLIGAGRALGVSVSARRHRKHKVRHAKNPADATANGWLELQYGWKPLLQDIYGSAEMIDQKIRRSVRTRLSTSKSIVKNGFDIVDDRAWSHARSRWTSKFTMKNVVYYSTPSATLQTLVQCGVTNPALIVWELTPWSFVVDWLLPIGNYLSSLDATDGLVFEKGCQTHFLRFQQENFGWGGRQGSKPVYADWKWDRASLRTYVKCDRFTLSEFPKVALPQFKSPFSDLHLANLTALLLQTFQR